MRDDCFQNEISLDGRAQRGPRATLKEILTRCELSVSDAAAFFVTDVSSIVYCRYSSEN